MFLRGVAVWSDGRREEAIDTLLNSMRTSTDFPTAYFTVLQLAQGIYREDRDLAKRALVALHAYDRTNPMARNVLGELRRRYPPQ